jgi:L-alanine-DL-glutamate epimerase-like enolase superfamily enzyme
MNIAPHKGSPLAIRRIDFFSAVSPVSQRIADATHDIPEIRFLIAEIELENGTTGQGYLLAFHYFPQAIVGALRDIAEFVKGYYKDYDVPLLCTIPNRLGAESFDWIDGLIDNRMEIKDGMARPRPSPGWGFGFVHNKMTAI